MITPDDERVVPMAALNLGPTGNSGRAYVGATPSGPPGSATFTMFCIMNVVRQISVAGDIQQIFSKNVFSGAGGGWLNYYQNGSIVSIVTNSTPAGVIVSANLVTLGLIGQPLIYVASYVNGTLTAWINGSQTGTMTLGAGYTGNAIATGIGCRPSAPATNNLLDIDVAHCGFLNGYDAAATVAAFTAQWQEDLQQGRDLTWPRAAVANSDWLWDPRDVCAGPATRATWTDRYSGVVLNKNADPQSSQMMPRF